MDFAPIAVVIIIVVAVGLAFYLRNRIEQAEPSRSKPGSFHEHAAPQPQEEAEPPSPKREASGLFDDEKPGAGVSVGALPTTPPAQVPPQPAPAAPPGSQSAKPDDRTTEEKKRDTGNLPVEKQSQPSSADEEPGARQPSAAPPLPEDEPSGAIVPESPVANTEDVRFTAFYPREASVEAWYTLLVYAHIEAAMGKVQADATRFKDEMAGEPREVRGSTPAKLARGTEITVLPQIDGVEFNPERVTFKWVEDFHRAEFRMRAKKELADTASNGTITIFVGPLIVATIKLAMLFNANSAPLKQITNGEVSTLLYKQEQIFASYSHVDTPIVLACRDAYQALGYSVLIDVDTLRAGENWSQALRGLIDRADIFQLFWSQRSAQSEQVRQEWQYALQKSKEKVDGFIRPVYWEKPLITPPPELEPLHFAYVPLAKPE